MIGKMVLLKRSLENLSLESLVIGEVYKEDKGIKECKMYFNANGGYVTSEWFNCSELIDLEIVAKGFYIKDIENISYKQKVLLLHKYTEYLQSRRELEIGLCEYCKEVKEKLFFKADDSGKRLDVEIEDNQLCIISHIDYNYVEEYIDISYCPMCGRTL